MEEKPTLFANLPSREVQIALSQIAQEKNLTITSLRFGERNSMVVREKDGVINGWALVNRGIKGKFDPIFAPLTNWDYRTEKRMASVQNNCLRMMDRMDPMGTIDYEQRLMLFRYLVCYWTRYLQNNHVKLFFSPSVPHEVTDYILFSMCRMRKIQTLLINYTGLPGRYFLGPDWRPPNTCKQPNNANKLPDNIKAAMCKIRQTHREAAPNGLKKLLSEKQNFKANFGAMEYSKLLLGENNALLRYKEFLLLSRQRFCTQNEWISRINNVRHRQRLDGFAKTGNLYRRVARKQIPRKPFVYFCLNYQPEMTTSPMGGVFVDMFLAVATIAQCLPTDWTIAVKEHPAQYIEYGSYNYIGRSRNFYRPYAAIPNLQFISMDVPHFDLIDRSQCVACVNGTVGWQAVVRQKPVMAFGEAWYKYAPGVFSVGNSQQVRTALSAIQNGISPTTEGTCDWLKGFLSFCTDEIYLSLEDAEEWSENFNPQKTISELRDQIKKYLKEA